MNPPARKKLHLTDRQKEVMEWAAKGKSALSTGIILGISQYSVSHHRKEAMAKVDTTNMLMATIALYKQGLIDV